MATDDESDARSGMAAAPGAAESVEAVVGDGDGSFVSPFAGLSALARAAADATGEGGEASGTSPFFSATPAAGSAEAAEADVVPEGLEAAFDDVAPDDDVADDRGEMLCFGSSLVSRGSLGVAAGRGDPADCVPAAGAAAFESARLRVDSAVPLRGCDAAVGPAASPLRPCGTFDLAALGAAGSAWRLSAVAAAAEAAELGVLVCEAA